MIPAVLSIAGSDCSGGAGIQADLKTIAAHQLYGESVICALTAQNTQGVRNILPVPASFVADQVDAVFDDIPPQAIKVGMVGSAEIVEVVAERLSFYKASSIVVDPVMVASSGSVLSERETIRALISTLFPLASLITPNLAEAEVLSGRAVADSKAMEHAAHQIAEMSGGAVLIKGGHLPDCADDLLLDQEGHCHWLRGRRIPTANTHGTGCTLSSAIACNLAKAATLLESVEKAKAYVAGALAHDPRLGKGSGPLDHLWAYR